MALKNSRRQYCAGFLFLKGPSEVGMQPERACILSVHASIHASGLAMDAALIETFDAVLQPTMAFLRTWTATMRGLGNHTNQQSFNAILAAR